MKSGFWFLGIFVFYCLQTLSADILPADVVLIPAGTFQMGDSFGEGHLNERPIHTVIVDSFAMGKYEITNSQYCDFLKAAYPSQLKVVGGVVYASNDSGNSFPYSSTSSASSGHPNYGEYSQIAFVNNTFSVRPKGGRDMTKDPMVIVSWYGAVAYCNWRSQQESKQPCYNLSTWTCDFSKKGYRLATEAEWEYAARGGRSGNRFPWGNTITHSQANYYSDSQYSYDISSTRGFHPTWGVDGIWPFTSPVGSFPANDFGLYDMVGNVWEWCHDWFGNYSSSSQANPTGPTTGKYRVARSSAWGSYAFTCRVSIRGDGGDPSGRYSGIGFRIVLGNGLIPVTTPSFSPDPGKYDNPMEVTITCTTPDVEIHYTTNGNDPTENDPIVASGGSITVDHSLVLKAKAWRIGYEPSEICQASYSIIEPDQQYIIFGKQDGKDIYWYMDSVNTCSKKSCVEKLADGLHLRIRKIDGKWYTSGVFTNGSLGYGVYKFTVATNTTNLDPSTVVGLFTFDLSNRDKKNEIDIELTRWGNPNNGYNAQQAIYIPNTDSTRTLPEVGNLKQLGESYTLDGSRINQTNGVTTHIIDWNKDRVILESYYGPEPSEDSLIYRYRLFRNNEYIIDANNNFPAPGPEKTCMNLWLCTDLNTFNPSWELQEVVIQNFEFTKWQSVQNSDFENTTLDGWTIEGPGTAKITEDPSNPTNYVCELTTGSPVSLKQNIQTPTRGFKILFDYRFLTPTGFLEIYLNSHLIGSVEASTELQNQMTEAPLRVIDPTLCGLEDSELVFKFDGPSGSQMYIDNVILETLPAIAGDLNDDCRVDIVDLSFLSNGWEQEFQISDLMIIAEHWISECSI
jgi:formylglycine-generating enzyme required for sulfatase activity